MRQTCIKCGKCQSEVRQLVPAGYCPMCGTASDVATERRQLCDALLPGPAGVGKV